jgi:DNA-directed RNA polymerase subunit alpha
MKIQILTEEEIQSMIAREICKLEARMIHAVSLLIDKKRFKNEVSSNDLVDVLMFSDRTRRILENANIDTIGKLTSYTEGQLLQYRCLGKNTLHEITARLSACGLKLKKP